MRGHFKIGLYELLSKDARIRRFKEFHDIEVKSILFFLMQVGNLKNKMVNNLKEMIYLNEKICIKKTYKSYIEMQELQGIEELIANLNTVDKEIEEYKNLRTILLEYIEKFDTTEKREIVVSFKSAVLYEKNIQKLYEKGAKDRTKLVDLLNQIAE